MDRKLFFDNRSLYPNYVMGEFVISGVDCTTST